MRYLDTTTDHVPGRALAQEIARVRAHLQRVERDLRRRPVQSLSPEQRAARRRNLDELHIYWNHGLFPRNYDQPGKWVPCFIDRTGQACAVAHLMLESGAGTLARQVAATANNAYIAELDGPAFDTWVAESGLSKAELARIQPMYPSMEDLQRIGAFMQTLAFPILGLVGIAILSTSRNIRDYLDERLRWVSILLGVLSGSIMLYLMGLFRSANADVQRIWRFWGPYMCRSGRPQPSPICLDNPPLPALANVVAWTSNLILVLGMAALVVGGASLLVFLKPRIAESPRLRRWLRYGGIAVVALIILALLLARPIQIARARLPAFPQAQVSTIVDEWSFFRGPQGVYQFVLQTRAAPQEVQQFYERTLRERGWIVQSIPRFFSATHYLTDLSGSSQDGSTVEISIEAPGGGLTYVTVRQQHGDIYLSRGGQ